MTSTILLTTCDLFKPGLGDKVDITPPAVAISAPSQNAYIRGTVTVNGSVSDDRGISTLTLHYAGIGGPVSKDITISGKTWSTSLVTGTGAADNLPNGSQQLTITAKDASGKSTDSQLFVFVDNVPPTVIVTVPQGYGGSRPTLSSVFDIKGEVWDTSPIQTVTVRLLDGGGATIASKLADGTNTWSARFDISSLAAFPNLGTFTYAVDVTDRAGNQNPYYYHARDIGILRDTYAPGQPLPATDEIGKLDQAGGGSTSGFTYAQLYATRLGPASSPSKYGDFTKDVDGTKPVVHYTNLDPLLPYTSNVVSTRVPLSGYANPGPSDNTGIVTTIHAWISDFSNQVWDATTAVDPSDVHANPIGSSINFRVEPRRGGSPSYLPSGHYVARVDAVTDGAATSIPLYCEFLVDAGAPDVGSPVPANLAFISRKTFTDAPLSGQQGIEMLVTASDDNPGLTFSASASLTDPGAALPGITWVDTGSGVYKVRVPVGGGNTDIFFTASATDSSGTTKTFGPVHYRIDELPPSVSITTPATDGLWVSGDSITVDGSASDLNTVSSIRYWLGLSTDTVPDVSTWPAPDGNPNWAKLLPLPTEDDYVLKAVSFDSAGNQSTVQTRTFHVDKSLPALDETAVGSVPVYRNSAFSLSGNVTDTHLSNLTITQKKNSGPPSTVLSQDAPLGPAWSWSVPGGETDGTFEYTITATDAAGKTTTLPTRTIIYDRVKPTITVTSLAPVLGTNTVNGIVTLQAAVSDGTALDKVWYRYGDAGPFTEITVNKTTPSLVIDTTNASNFPDLATTNVWLRASDLAGNVQDVSVALAVDQSSDNPAITLTNLDASRTTPGQASGNLLESNAKVTGTITDDDAVDPATVQISVNGGAYGAVGVLSGSGTSVGFEQSLNALSEGVNYFSVRAYDLASTKAGRPAVLKTLGPVYFAIDRNPPSLAVTAPAAGGLHNADFALSGTAGDANGLQGDLVTIKEGAIVIATPAVPVGGGAWSYTVPAASITEGAKSWTIEAVDTFGKTTNVPYSFTVDRSAPSLSILAPAAASWNTGATLSAVGTSSDANGVASVEWSTDGTTWSLASGTTTWSVLLNLITLGEGARTLYLRATDAAGNTTAPLTRAFGVDQTPPSTTETSVGPGTVGRSTLFTLAGIAADTNSLASVSIRQRKDGGGWVPVYTDATLTGTSASWTVPAGTLPRDPATPANPLLADGLFEYEITVTDVATNTAVVARTVRIDRTAPTAAIGDPTANAVLVGTAYSVSGTAADAGSGVASVQWWAGPFGDTPTSWNTATGTTNWNALLNLTTLGEGRRTLHVKAVDGAGNETAAPVTVDFYVDQAPPVLSVGAPASGAVFSSDFTVSGTASDANLSAVNVKINGGSWTPATGTTSWTLPVTLTSLSTGANTLTVEASDIAGRTTTQTLTVMRDQAAPVSVVTNLDSGGGTVLTESSPKLIGSVTDASGVASAESMIESYDYGTSTWSTVEGWTSLGAPAAAAVFPWQKDLGSTGLNLAEGRYRITLRASDVAGPAANSATAVAVVFTLDRTNPALALTAPGMGSFQKAAVTVSGTSSDANTVTSIKVKADSPDFSSGTISASTSDGYASWTATVPSGGLSAGPHTLYVQATDGASRTTVLTRDFTFDATAPTVSFITPLSGTSVNGAVTVKGTSSDANAVATVELKIGKDTVWNTLPGVYSWEYAFTNIDTYANTSYADETSPGSGVWRLVVHVRATDVAGNVSTVSSYYLDLDPGMDSPITTIYQPLDNQTVGGSTRVYGVATDDDAVYRVEMQIDVNGDGDFNDQVDYWNYDGTGTPTLAPDGSTNGRFEDETKWYPVTGTTNWFQVINQFGEYNAAVQGQTRTIHLRVRAVDTKDGVNPGAAGNFQQITVTFDNTVPIIENVALDGDALDNGNEIPYSTGLRVSGTFWIVATVKDNGGITQIDRLEQGPLAGSARIDTDGSVSTHVGWDGSFDVWKVRIPVNTLTIGGGVFAGTSGSYAVSLKATDNTAPNPYQTFSYLNIQVDNYYPSGVYTGNVSQVLGTNYKIQGTATDVGALSGIVQGVDRIEGYLVKAGQVYNPRIAGPGNHAALGGSITVKDDSTDSTIKSVGYPSTPSYLITIDKLTEVGVSDSAPNGDSDGYLESLTLSGNSYDWWAEVNTANLPDGPIDLHYIVFDKAGNGTHYVQTLYVRNNAPVVDSITLGTDLNGDGTIGDVASGESVQYTSGYGATGFTVRNSRLSLTIAASSGNGTRRYSVRYGGVEKNGILTGSTVTITDFSGMPDTTANGAVFQVTVFDSTISDDADATGELTQTGAPLSVGLTIDNVDDTPPTIAAAAFGQRYTQAVPNTDAGKSLVAVAAYTDNIVMSGVTRLGHVEYAADSLVNGADADVSGKVILKGKAWDNQRIQKITATITGFDPDGGGGAAVGSEFTVATWSGSGLTPASSAAPYWAFGLDAGSEAVTEANGHVLNWSFGWDTSQMTGGAGYNQSVTFKVYDFGPSGGNTATSVMTVDVVPYITDLQRGNGVNTNRTKYGRYPVQAGETNLVVNGFNLPSSTTPDASNWVRIYNSGGTANDAATITSTAGTARTSVTLTLPAATRSGFLRVSVNAIPDGNRQNDNTKTYDKEDDGSGVASTLWTDDRYLHLWTVNQAFATSDGAQYPSMSIMGDGTLYGSWIRYDTSLLYLGTTGAGPVTQWGIYDPPEYTDLNVDSSEATLKYAISFAANHYGGSGWGNAPLDVGSAGFLGARTPNSRQLANGYGNSIGYAIESLNLNQQLWQFNRPKIVRSNGGASDAQDRIHTAYYDAATKAVKYSFMYDDGFAGARGWLVLDGGTDAQDVRYVTGVATGRTNTTVTDATLIGNTMIANGQTIMLMNTGGQTTTYSTITGFNSGTGVVTFGTTGENTRLNYTIVTGTSNLVTAGVAQSTSAGDYVAIDVDEDGLPVVLYYNTAAQTLRLARANKVNPTSPADWVRQDVFQGGDPNSQFSGQYVAMKFDSVGNLYVVCYRASTGDLLYLYAPDADGGAAYSFQPSVVVDTVGAVGTWADISLEGAVPHVSYMNNAMLGTFDGIKYATLRPITNAVVGSSTTTSITSATLVGAAVAAGQNIVFSDGSSRVVSAFNSGTGQASWSTPLGSAPGAGTVARIVSGTDWEYEIIPASAAVTDQRTNIEVKRGAATWGDAAIGYRSTRFELVYVKPEP
ncbi:MAG TPA: Ig-like domain-containing protein [Spirochaetia bacterium]|nr:Ig-like domain-containing protein [Spirochaetia bacterium]